MEKDLLRVIAGVVYLSLLIVVGCSTDESVGTLIAPLESENSRLLQIEVLSSKPWLVTGGDALIEISNLDKNGAFKVQLILNNRVLEAELVNTGIKKWQVIVQGMGLGKNILEVKSAEETSQITIDNFSESGPIISGPHQKPYVCQTEEFELAIGGTLGPALDNDCSIETRIDYLYRPEGSDVFKLFNESSKEYPPDVSFITLENGVTIPQIIRVETGTVNRAVYEIAMLHDPNDTEVSPWSRSAGWNGKLIYTHGGGCRGGWYRQGTRSGGVIRPEFFEIGYAVVSSSLNVFGQNCNDLLASETHIMVKEKFIEGYGVPEFTIGFGASGGSYQAHQTADNYPGVFDGIIVSSSFPDVITSTTFTSVDARLLHRFFDQSDPFNDLVGFNEEQQLAVSGFGVFPSISNLSRSAARVDPLYREGEVREYAGGETSLAALASQRATLREANGLRMTIYDHGLNIYRQGPSDISEPAIIMRPLDNVGVQYGLKALNNGMISPQQFVELNAGIGGFDENLDHVSTRHRAESAAARIAISSGRVLFGGGGLSTTPIIDYRTYTDFMPDGDLHMIGHQFSTRARLINVNGNSGNQVMKIGGKWGFDEGEGDLADIFAQMDAWLMAIKNDPSTDVSQRDRVIEAKPSGLTDVCWDNEAVPRVKHVQKQQYQGDNLCSQLYPAFSSPRQEAGSPLANNIIKCALKEISWTDYDVEFNPDQREVLGETFPDGVCDWISGESESISYQGTWLSFGPSLVNQVAR
tara:strand:- start:11931 stop:14189 length:2259 start_codon:yes stop_codon:yes gene_type:complete